MGYIKTYRNSKNVMNPAEVNFYSQTSLGASTTLVWTYSSTASGRTVRIPVKPNTQYIVKPYGDAVSSTIWRIATCNSEDIPNGTVGPTTVDVRTIVSSTSAPANGTYLWTDNDVKYIVMQINSSIYTDINDFKTLVGIYEVSEETTPTPSTCEPYNITDWYDWIKKKTASGWTEGNSEKAPF